MAWLNPNQLSMFEPSTFPSENPVTSSPASAVGHSPLTLPAGLAIAKSGPAPVLVSPSRAPDRTAAFADERHLWPEWFRLIGKHRPRTIFGEQVEGPAGRAWLDLVFTDLEAIGYACGAVVFPTAGVGAPHIRHRTYWVADAWERRGRRGKIDAPKSGRDVLCDSSEAGGMEYADMQRERPARNGEGAANSCGAGEVSRLADADEGQRVRSASLDESEHYRQASGWQQGDGVNGIDC